MEGSHCVATIQVTENSKNWVYALPQTSYMFSIDILRASISRYMSPGRWRLRKLVCNVIMGYYCRFLASLSLRLLFKTTSNAYVLFCSSRILHTIFLHYALLSNRCFYSTFACTNEAIYITQVYLTPPIVVAQQHYGPVAKRFFSLKHLHRGTLEDLLLNLSVYRLRRINDAYDHPKNIYFVSVIHISHAKHSFYSMSSVLVVR